LIFGATS
jgi:hypothetical protein